MTKNIHWCRNCNQAGVPNIACVEEKIPRVSFDEQSTNTDMILVLKESMNSIVDTINSMRRGSADDKQFKATIEHNLNIAVQNERNRIMQIIKENGHQQEDNTIWVDMDELLKKITI
jgi:hypothetical protein